MTPGRKTALRWFWGGVAAFIVAIALHIPLFTDGVPGGIGDHQKAPDAATVNAIQQSWAADGLIGLARAAMISDLIFIGIYGAGCVLAGLHFRSSERYWPSLFGWIALFCGAIFIASDYGETIAQFMQLVRFRGDDTLAQFASGLRPLKINTFIAAFIAVALAQFLTRKSTGDA